MIRFLVVAYSLSFLNPKDLDSPTKIQWKICHLVMYRLLFVVTTYH